MSLDEALKVVRLAGYRVSKPKPKKQWRVGPTCVVMYADGVTCRMTTHTNDESPDFDRGLRLCAFAWQSRTGKNYLSPPLIQRAWFERNGDVIAVYQPEAIAA